MLEQNNEKEVEIERLFAQAQLLGRNRMPPIGMQNSSWYVGPYPTFQMIDALRDENISGKEEENHSKERIEDFEVDSSCEN